MVTYRFAIYYLGAPDFKHAGPPELLLRVIGPLLVITTVVLMASGIVLLYARPDTPTVAFWLSIHRDDFIAWFALMVFHALVYVRRAVGTSGNDLRYMRYHFLIGRQGRLISIALAIVIGLLLAWAVFPAVAHWSSFFSVHPSR
jgi:amino acid permease